MTDSKIAGRMWSRLRSEFHSLLLIAGLIFTVLHPSRSLPEDEISNVIRRDWKLGSRPAENNNNGASASNFLGQNFAHNLSSIVASVGGKCAQFCGDQTQYNGICKTKGCAEWKNALKSGCFISCSGVDSNYRENYACQVGCSRAVEEYYVQLNAILNTLVEPPELASNSLKSTSLRLSWEGSGDVEFPFLAFSVQGRALGRGGLSGGNEPSLWETVTQNPTVNSTIASVVNLKPYTWYQFRVGWIVASDFPPIFTGESHPIQTLEKGLPSAPAVTSIQPISNTSVAVTWTPPAQPNGRLIAYILKLQPVHGHAIIKELPSSQNPRGYTFSGLQPTTNYSLAVSAQNMEGEGEATQVYFVTPETALSSTNGSKSLPARFLIQGVKSVYVQPLDLLMDPDVPFYTSGTSGNVSAIAIHVKLGHVFIATTDGAIRRTLIGSSETSNEVAILSKERLELGVSHLSVDWLHEKLYIVGKKRRATNWVIKRCEFDGSGLITVYSKLFAKPVHFAADPFTGYLYWVAPPTHSKGGLFKLDILPENRNELQTSIQARAVLEENSLGPFTVDAANYRILIVQKSANTVLSVSLDGDTTDIRHNTRSPKWANASSLVLYNGVLYCTTQTGVVDEEYNPGTDEYYQNSFDAPKSVQPLGQIFVLHPEAQPTPIPLAAPQNLQVLYSETRARITWRPPPPISALGAGAWCSWSYQLSISDNRTFRNITNNEFTLEGLKASTYYTVQVLAYSEAGVGPPSFPHRGKSLRFTGANVTLVWGSYSGLWTTDTLGEHLTLLTSSPKQNRMQSIAWTEANSVFFALSNGTVFSYTNDGAPRKNITVTKGISFAQSIAYDHIGQRLYWSNPKQLTIMRCPLTAALDCSPGSREALQIVTMAKEIAVDSVKGLLLWNTEHSIEMSRMNGYAHGVLYQHGMFSGKQIKGITLDTEQSRVYWITRSGSGTTVQRLQYSIRGTQLPMVIASYEDNAIVGPIRYFNERLLWIQGSSEAAITDLHGQSKSTLKLGTVMNITNVFVKDEGSFKRPKQNVQVIPDQVAKWSVEILGRWNNFSLVWAPVNNTNYGKVLYEVSVDNVTSKVTEQTSITFDGGSKFQPYSEIIISITALTYWASAKATICRRRVPSWKPSEPLNPRAFIAQNSSVELRWDEPASPSGLILGYLAQCYVNNVKVSNCHCEVDMTALSCIFRGPAKSSVEILAYTSAGFGPPSKKIPVEPKILAEIPKLFVVSGDNKIGIFDVDRGTMRELSLGYLAPVSGAWIGDEVFWFNNEGQDLMRAKLEEGPGFNKTRMLTLSGYEAGNLNVDWIGRKLYFSVEAVVPSANSSLGKHGIMMVDLTEDGRNHPNAQPLLATKTSVKSIAFNPFRNAVYYTTSRGNTAGSTNLYMAEVSGNFSVRPFLVRNSEVCNCSQITLSREPIFYSAGERSLNFVSAGHLVSADENGCNCQRRWNISSNSSPEMLLASDQSNFYLGNEAGSIFAAPKTSKKGAVILKNSAGIRTLVPYGSYAQPSISRDCLAPLILEPETVLLINHSSHELQLQLPLAKGNCSGSLYQMISLPTTMYSVYYGTLDSESTLSKCTPSSPAHCKVIRTTARALRVPNLAPYTAYSVFVSVKNHYSLEPRISSPVLLRTAAGAPSPPEIPDVTLLSPTALRVKWKRPEKLNGEVVWYEVHWKNNQIKSSRNASQAKWADDDSSDRALFEKDLINLLPSTNYTVWIRAWSEKGDAWSDSGEKSVSTFPLPRTFLLTNSTPHSLHLEWVPPEDNSIIMHQVLYSEEEGRAEADWKRLPFQNFTIPGKAYKFVLSGLKANSPYFFRLLAWYGSSGDPKQGPFHYPVVGSMKFSTIPDRPSPPKFPPVARGIGKDLYEVSWEAGDENGAEIELYSLEAKMTQNLTEPLSRSKRELPQNFSEWTQVYSGKETRWIVEGLDHFSYYSFRVRARNMYGWSVYTGESSSVSLATLTLMAEPPSIGAAVGTVVASLVVVGFFAILFVMMYRRKQTEKPVLQITDRHFELATLRELPGGNNFIHQSNVLYIGNGNSVSTVVADLILDVDLAGVPKISCEQITVTKFLGSGAFGEVWEGKAKYLGGVDDDGEERVAIKMLRKGANSTEKQEFVQEAKLMAQFRHPHIIQLMGICVDTDPCCLLLELMGEGDLLSHLRSNRPGGAAGTNLSLVDLLGMCVDVAKGCVYLEEMHFVHRDIAARNCLVSLNESKRLVKIGDFGLARDIYRNDYYRKDGEGLLPVRWMAPESLVYGIFTTQSDVWAFGVLVWEIMTLGQQPYPARSNVDVLNYVRNGGRLQEPDHCPHILGNLMLQCWEYAPENRPSFKDCLTQLELILLDFEESAQRSCDLFSVPEINFDPYSYSDETPASAVVSYATPRLYDHEDGQGGGHDHMVDSERRRPRVVRPTPNYLRVVDDELENRYRERELGRYIDEGYEIPLPRRPPRSKGIIGVRNPPPEIGLPPPMYWNSEAFVAPKQNNQFRNLLASCTSEEADMDEPESQASTSCSASPSEDYRPISISNANSGGDRPFSGEADRRFFSNKMYRLDDASFSFPTQAAVVSYPGDSA